MMAFKILDCYQTPRTGLGKDRTLSQLTAKLKYKSYKRGEYVAHVCKVVIYVR